MLVNQTDFKSHFAKIMMGLTALSWSSLSLAAGFQVQEQNAVNLGTAYSGTAAWAVDASSAFYNPAALTHIKNKQLVVSGVLISSSADFTASSTNLPFVPPAAPVPGPQTDNPGGLSAVPSLYYAARINPNLVFGLAVAAPFGLVTDYAEDRVMRYVATRSELVTLDFSPSLAYKATNWLSLAAGLDALFAEATLNAQTNITGSAADDGFQKNRANDWDLGWHAGFLIDLCDKTRIGVNYRSKYNLHAEGISEQKLPLGLGLDGAVVVRNLSSDVVLPDTIVLSAYHDFNPCWAVMADIHWTAWSRFNTLGLRFDPLPSVPPFIVATDTDTIENFKDTVRLALGVNYKYNCHWQFRAGTAFDQSPVRDEFRTARIPDSDRVWLGVGASYCWAQTRIDVGYAHLFFKDSDLNDSGPLNAATQMPAALFNNVTGKYSSHADILGVQLRYDFV